MRYLCYNAYLKEGGAMWTKEEIGQVIKESRLSAGLTQKQVAEFLNRPQQTIASWETGKSQPDANTLFVLFQILGRSLDEAFGFSDNPKNSPGTAEAAPGEDISDMFDKLNDLLVSTGLIKDGNDLTAQQADILLAVCRIINATFQE